MSSYRGHFRDLSPSDQADIASWNEFTDRLPSVCDLCNEIIEPEDLSVEAFEIAGCLTCTDCLEALAEQGACE